MKAERTFSAVTHIEQCSLAHLPRSPAVHFRMAFYQAVLYLLSAVMDHFETAQELNERFPFLIDYNNELAEFGLQGMTIPDAIEWWTAALAEWEQQGGAEYLPLLALRQAAGLSSTATALWLAVGLIEEDVRFGSVFELLNGHQRPTFGLLQSWENESGDGLPARRSLQRLIDLGLLEVTNPDAPRLEWTLQVPGVLWDALLGLSVEELAESVPQVQHGWLVYHRLDQLTALEDVILPMDLREQVERLPALFEQGDLSAVVVRGFQHNGRCTLLGALARSMGCGVLEMKVELVHGKVAAQASDVRGGADTPGLGWRAAGPLATLLHSMPLIHLELAPGEKAEIPELPGYRGLVGVVLGPTGAVSGELVENSVSLTLDMPGPDERTLHWAACLDVAVADIPDLAETFRLTGGNIRRMARLALAAASLERRSWLTLEDVRQAGRALNRQALETLAQPLEPYENGPFAWGLLAVDALTQAELITLEKRCRYREFLPDKVGAAFGHQLNCGVRALFSGPSGVGKTLAARLLAGVLQKDLYRLDLSAVVNKYIGETEKNLNKVFARAEELDVVLLIDEGDTLLTQRTAVSTANDRYANLETNYLLQRIESYQGILIVTTNASEHIDSAFHRRMDVVVEFRAPDAAERYAIWQLHLPLDHQVEPAYLEATAVRCLMNGGQIRNAVLHASLLALQDGERITSEHLHAAVQREYRKLSTVCPLPQPGMQD